MKQLLGRRGSFRAQSGINHYDTKTRVLFSTHLQKNSIDCWRFDNTFKRENIETIDQNDETLYYPVDLIVSHFVSFLINVDNYKFLTG